MSCCFNMVHSVCLTSPLVSSEHLLCVLHQENGQRKWPTAYWQPETIGERVSRIAGNKSPQQGWGLVTHMKYRLALYFAHGHSPYAMHCFRPARGHGRGGGGGEEPCPQDTGQMIDNAMIGIAIDHLGNANRRHTTGIVFLFRAASLSTLGMSCISSSGEDDGSNDS